MTEPAPKDEKKWLSVTAAALKIKVRYHRTRDLILQGVLGDNKYEGRNLMVDAAGVQAYLDREKKPIKKVAKKSPSKPK